jgi:hypothetical protein
VASFTRALEDEMVEHGDPGLRRELIELVLERDGKTPLDEAAAALGIDADRIVDAVGSMPELYLRGADVVMYVKHRQLLAPGGSGRPEPSPTQRTRRPDAALVVLGAVVAFVVGAVGWGLTQQGGPEIAGSTSSTDAASATAAPDRSSTVSPSPTPRERTFRPIPRPGTRSGSPSAASPRQQFLDAIRLFDPQMFSQAADPSGLERALVELGEVVCDHMADYGVDYVQGAQFIDDLSTVSGGVLTPRQSGLIGAAAGKYLCPS